MSDLLMDLRYSWRLLFRQPSAAALAIVTMALGIGATTSVFSVAYAVLIRPLPYPEPGRLVALYEEHPGAPKPPGEPEISNTTMYAWRQRLTTLEAVAAYAAQDYSVSIGGESARLHGSEASPELFRLLRASPQLGTFYSEEQAAPRHNAFVVISDRLWRERFGSRPDIVGTPIVVDGRSVEVVAVTAPDFHFPDKDAQIWTPFDDPTLVDPSVQGGMWLTPALGRLRPGATVAAAAAEGTSVARSIKRPAVADILFGHGGPVEVRAETLNARMTHDIRPVLYVLGASVSFVLLLVCANVGNLFLSRGVARQRELAVRSAVGADLTRLMRQLLTESFLLAAAGGVCGLLLAGMLIRLLPAVAPSGFPRLDSVRFDWMVVLVSTFVSLIVALVAAVVPALRSVRCDLISGLRGAHAAEGHRPVGRALVIAEAAIAALLIVGAALFGRSLARLTEVDPGYDTANVLIARIFPPSRATPAETQRLMDRVIERVSSDSRVLAAGAGNMTPFADTTYISAFDLPESIARPHEGRPRAITYRVSAGYAAALGLRLRDGRWLIPEDARADQVRVVVNREFVRQYMKLESPVGLAFPGGPFGPKTNSLIVGVVDNVLAEGNDARPRPEVYAVATTARPIMEEIDLVVRTTADAAALGPLVQDAVRAVEPEAALGGMTSLERRLAT